MNKFSLPSIFLTMSLLFNVAAFAANDFEIPSGLTENRASSAPTVGRYPVKICEIEGNQLARGVVFNFYDLSGNHITGGRTNNDQCVETTLSNVREGQKVKLAVEKRNGGDHWMVLPIHFGAPSAPASVRISEKDEPRAGDRFLRVNGDKSRIVVVNSNTPAGISVSYVQEGGASFFVERANLASLSGCNAEYMCVDANKKFYNEDRSNRVVAIFAIQFDGTLVLRYDDTNALGSGWTKSSLTKTEGCVDDDLGKICVGQRFVNVDRANRTVTVVGIAPNGKLLLRYEDSNELGGGWDAASLARLKGCNYQQVCVGQSFINTDRGNRPVTVFAIQPNGKLLLRYTDTNELGGGWTAEDLKRFDTVGSRNN